MANASGTLPRLLLVEDEELTRASLRRLLGVRFDVVETSSALRALALVAGGEKFHIVLADLNLNDAIDGVVLFETLRSLHPSSFAAFTLMSSGDLSPRAQRLVDDGVIHFLRKPFRRADALSLLTSLI